MTKATDATRIYFASDIHGSEKCWRKFLNAGKFYQVDVLIMGGDITGKILIPVLQRPSGFCTAHYMGNEYRFTTENEIQEFEKGVRDHGCYPMRITEEEWHSYDTEEKKHNLFVREMVKALERWMDIAADKLKDSRIRCYVLPGNDDIWEVDGVISRSKIVINPEGQCLQLDERHEMIAVGASNPTPWDTYREKPEEQLARDLEDEIKRAANIANLVAVLHAPPFGTGIDSAPKLSQDFKVERSMGEAQMVPVGSTAVRDFIQKYQPLLTLHGHIHEARGIKKIGRTICINPGSEYTEGILSGALIELNCKGIRSYQLVSG